MYLKQVGYDYRHPSVEDIAGSSKLQHHGGPGCPFIAPKDEVIPGGVCPCLPGVQEVQKLGAVCGSLVRRSICRLQRLCGKVWESLGVVKSNLAVRICPTKWEVLVYI